MSSPEETLKALLAAGVVLAMSCGPIQSTAVLLDAENMMEAARTAQAEKLAPYEWTAAGLYFAKSKEEVGASEFEAAVGYGKKALDFAKRARDVALKNGRRDEGLQPPVAPE